MTKNDLYNKLAVEGPLIYYILEKKTKKTGNLRKNNNK